MIMSRACVDPHHCITCSDEGIAMRVVSVNVELGSALCRELQEGSNVPGDVPATEPQEVLTGLLPDVAAGDVILVHAGAALIRIDAVRPVADNAAGTAP